MIIHSDRWGAWERRYRAQEPVNPQKNMALMESLYQEACQIGAFFDKEVSPSLAVKIKLAKVLNVPKAA